MIFDIIIYGEFDYIVRAFKFTAMMFSPATGYIGFVGAIGVAAIMFGILSVLAGQVSGGKGSLISWAINTLFAIIIIFSSTGVKCEMIIHDKTLNKIETVGGVPALMGALAYAQNTISNTTKDMITTIMAPIVSYDLIGKGQGFELLSSLDSAGKDFFNRNPQTLESLGNYMQNCVGPDMTYGWVDAKAYNYPVGGDMWAALKSETMTRFSPVVTIDAAGKRSSIPMPCAQAYREINYQLSSSEMQNTLKNQCAQNVGDGLNEQTACVSILTGLFGDMVAPGVGTNVVIRNYLVSWAYMSKHGMLASALNDMNKKNASGAFMAEQVLPKLKGMMFGLIIGIFPFLVAFVWITPGKTVTFYCGLFLLMILWNAIDTFMDMQYQNEVYNMYSVMRKNGLGLQQMFDIPNIAADAVSLYGQGRWMTLGFASAITAAITGISTHALSSMGSQLTATAQGAAASGAQYMDTAGQARLSEKANIDAGARTALSQATVANWSGMANYETQRMMSDMKTGNAMSNTLGNAGTASYRADNAVDSLTGSHGGFSGDKAMAQATGFSNLEQYRDWANKGKIIDQNVANSLTANGVPTSVAQNAVGLSMASAGLGTDGNITNFGAKGIDANGQDRSVSLAENVARFQVQNGSQNIAGFDIGNGGNVTAKYNPDGSVSQLGVEGAGYTRFSHNPATGATSGTHAFEKNGIEYTNRYQGNDLTTSFMDKTGDSITRHSMRDGNGQYNAYKTDITVGHNGYDIDGVQFQEGSTVTQGAGGMMTANGAFMANGMTYKGSITTDENGAMVSILGENGQTFNQNDISNITKERMTRNASGKVVSTGEKYDFDDQAVAQAIAAGRGDRALGIVMEQYKAAQIYDEQLKENHMYGVMNNPYQENYQKALAEYSISAANGVSGVVSISKSASHQYSMGKSDDEINATSLKGGGSVNLGASTKGFGDSDASANIGLNAGFSKSYTTQTTESRDENRSGAIQINRNEITDRVRDEVVKGLQAGLSTDQIDKNINENVLMK